MGQENAGGSGDTLKPCKRCGSEAELYAMFPDLDDPSPWTVYCTNVECEGNRSPQPSYPTPKQAVKDWNDANTDWRQLAQRAGKALQRHIDGVSCTDCTVVSRNACSGCDQEHENDEEVVAALKAAGLEV